MSLFQRGSGHLRLTDAGRRLQPVLRQSFDRIAWTVRGLQEPDAVSHLRLNAPPTFANRWLIPRLGRLKSLHPDLELSLTTRADDDLVGDENLDAAIRFGTGEWSDAEVVHLMQESHIAVCAPKLRGLCGVMRSTSITRCCSMSCGEDRFHTWDHWLSAAGIEGVKTSGDRV